jgi:signal transduction histidine kinase
VQPPVNILLVDDEVRNLDTLESVLHSPDYRLIRALTAKAALMELLEGEFAVIVLDIQMPEMSGIELANLIKQRKRTRHIPIIFLTAYFQEDTDMLEGYSTGAVDYLTKPINPQILKSKIAVFVELFRKTRALASTNRALGEEVAQRQKAEAALQENNEELETRVRERTADLSRLNGELSLARDRALAASRAKDDFLATLSHELRTPLSPVLLLAGEGANNADLPAEVRADFATIAENVALEARLIDDLLDLTRIARGKLSLELRPIDLHAALRAALAMVQAEVRQKSIALTLRLEPGSQPVLGDDVRLKQVFWNVIKNAVKFTPPGGGIVVETRARSESSRLSVLFTDTGIGMTAGEITRAFEAFSQGDHANAGTSHRFGGLGLGLAISRQLVELHAGTITATSGGRNQGTTFQIELPLQVTSAVGAATS